MRSHGPHDQPIEQQRADRDRHRHRETRGKQSDSKDREKDRFQRRKEGRMVRHRQGRQPAVVALPVIDDVGDVAGGYQVPDKDAVHGVAGGVGVDNVIRANRAQRP